MLLLTARISSGFLDEARTAKSYPLFATFFFKALYVDDQNIAHCYVSYQKAEYGMNPRGAGATIGLTKVHGGPYASQIS